MTTKLQHNASFHGRGYSRNLKFSFIVLKTTNYVFELSQMEGQERLDPLSSDHWVMLHPKPMIYFTRVTWVIESQISTGI